MIREAFVLMKRLGISVIVLLMLPVLVVIAKPGQSERFEVASVKPSIAGLAPTIGILPGGRFAASSVTEKINSMGISSSGFANLRRP
jgi:hypothetical protein